MAAGKKKKPRRRANAWVKVRHEHYLRLRRIEQAANHAADVLDEIEMDEAQEAAAEIRRAKEGYLSPYVQ